MYFGLGPRLLNDPRPFWSQSVTPATLSCTRTTFCVGYWCWSRWTGEFCYERRIRKRGGVRRQNSVSAGSALISHLALDKGKKDSMLHNITKMFFFEKRNRHTHVHALFLSSQLGMCVQYQSFYVQMYADLAVVVPPEQRFTCLNE